MFTMALTVLTTPTMAQEGIIETLDSEEQLRGALVLISDEQVPPLGPELKYIRQADRESTRRATIAQYLPEGLDYGPWWVIGPFPNSGHGELDRLYPPEQDGFKPDAVYKGKHGIDVTWRRTDFQDNSAMNLRIFGDNPSDNRFNEDAAVYLYREIRIGEPADLKVHMGSDDGVKVWHNGRVIVHADVLRGWESDQHVVTLHLEPGVNTILAKVVNRGVGFNYSFGYDNPLDPLLDAMLEYQLDLDFPRSPEDEYYRMLTIPVPRDIVLEVGGLDVLPDGRPAVATRRGEVWLVSDAYADPPFSAAFTRFASGLHEPLGLVSRDNAMYLVQRGELTRLIDEDGDGRADRFETVYDGWGLSGNYHEFAFGPKFDREGNMWVALNLGFCGGLGKSIVPWRGWALKITPDGKMTPVCGGMRSPNGIGMNAAGDMFYVDNQGDWVGTCPLVHMESGDFCGHPGANQWYDHPAAPGENPGKPAAGPDGPLTMYEAAKVMPSLKLPAVWFPYGRMGQSSADIICDQTGGRFGPFAGQLFVGDQTTASIARVFLEQVDGKYQGACFPFRSGFDCGVNRMCWGIMPPSPGPAGEGRGGGEAHASMFVGMTNRGWGSLGRKPWGLQRLVWTGRTPFEILEMKALSDGFELAFTQPVDREAASDAGAYAMKSFTYWYHEPYGSPEIRNKVLTIREAIVSEDALRVRLVIDGLREGFVHELTAPGVRSAEGKPLLHAEAYYTLNRLPDGPVARVEQP